MPVKWVLHWVPNVGAATNTQILNEISQCVESLNGVKEGRWKSIITFYKPITREISMAVEFPRDFLGLSIPDQPNKYYFIIRGQRIVFEADSNIQAIMEKLQSYKSKVSLNFEGIQYQVGDFQLRVGKVSPSNSEAMRGIVMEVLLELEVGERGVVDQCSFEVEYLPLSSVDKSRQVMEDFVGIWKETLSKRSVPGQFLVIQSNYAEYGLSDQYTSQHTAVQYANVMAQMIAIVQTSQQVRN